MKTIHILVADDHELVRVGIKAVVSQCADWRVCGEASNGREAVELALRFKPEVAVLDIGMPELNGLDAARQIRQACPATEVLILTMLDSEDLVRKALAAGVRGFIFKTDTSRLLVAAIEALAQHKPFFTSAVAEALLARHLNPDQAAQAEAAKSFRLTARETEIVQLLAEAKTSKETAVRLGVSVKTVEAHRANIMRKLNLHSIAELVRYAVRNQIIQP